MVRFVRCLIVRPAAVLAASEPCQTVEQTPLAPFVGGRGSRRLPVLPIALTGSRDFLGTGGPAGVPADVGGRGGFEPARRVCRLH